MIKYVLVCEGAHNFESWFPDSVAYDVQVKRGLVVCPDCGSPKIGKAVMSPSVARRDRPSMKTPAEPAADAGSTAGTPPEAPQPVALLDEREQMIRALVRELRVKIAENTDDVGARFPEEARRMHEGDIPHRSIRGEASLEDARLLLEDGVEIMPVPRLPEEWN